LGEQRLLALRNDLLRIARHGSPRPSWLAVPSPGAASPAVAR